MNGLTNNNGNIINGSFNSSNLIGTSASARLPFEKQLRNGADNSGVSSRVNISHLISQSLLPNKNRLNASPTTTAAAAEVLGKDL